MSWRFHMRCRRRHGVVVPPLGSTGENACGTSRSHLWSAFLGLDGSAVLVDSPLLSVVAISIGAAGTLAILPIFWTLPAAILSGAAAAGGIALINAIGNIGGFAGPFVIGWIKETTGSFT